MKKPRKFKVKYIVLEWKPDYNEYAYYGWTFEKAIMKLFLAQRKKGLYKIIKIDDEKQVEAMTFVEDMESYNKMIELYRFTSTYSGEEYTMYMTTHEMKNVEQAIQDYFIDLASLKNTSDPNGCFTVYANLKQKYLDALELIGFRPPECDAIYTPNEERSAADVKSLISDQLSEAYDREYSGLSFREGKEYSYDRPLGLGTLQEIYSHLLYSIESVVKVMKDVLR